MGLFYCISMHKPKLSRYLLPISLAAFLFIAILLIGFEPQTRRFFGGNSTAPYRFSVSTIGDTSALTAQIIFLEKRIERIPSSALDRSTLAATYAAQAKLTGDTTFYDKAQSLAQYSLKLLPFSNGGAKLTLATVAEARHQFKEAIAIARELQSEGKKTDGLSILITSHLALGELGEAALEADSFVNLKPGLGSLALKALVLTAQGRDEEAEFNFKRAILFEDIGQNQESAWVRCLLGRFYLKHGNLSEAKSLFIEATRIVPHYHFALSLLGELEMQSGHPEKAEKYFFEAFTASRQMPYFRNYGLTLKLQGKTQPATEVEKEAYKIMQTELDSKAYGHRLELAQLLIERKGPKDLTDAMALIQQELETRKSAPTYFVLASAYATLNQWEAANVAIQAVLRTGVREPKYFRLASEINKNLGYQDLSALYFQLAAKLNAKNLFDFSSVL